MRRLARFLGFVACQVLAVLLLCEGALRLLQPHVPGLATLLYLPTLQTDFDEIPDLPTLMRGTVQGYRPLQRQGDFVLNSRSMRTREYVGKKRPGVYRIAVLGDSFAHGSGGTPFRDMWPTRLEAELNRLGTRDVEVFSLGVGGVGPAFALRLWELERDLLRSDLVVFGFFVGNDFTDASGETPWEGAPARRRSLVVRLLGNAWRLRREREEVGAELLQRVEAAEEARGGYVANEAYVKRRGPRHSEVAFLEIEARSLQICLRTVRPWFDRRAEQVAHILVRFRDEVRASGAGFLVVMIPDGFQVDAELRARLLDHVGVDAEEIDVDHPQRRLASLLDQHGVGYLDLLPAFRERAAEERLYWLRNTHWNVAGNALAAQRLARHLASHVPQRGEP